MKIAIAGAGGSVAGQVVQRLVGSGATVVLVGADEVGASLPPLERCREDELSEAARGFDALLEFVVPAGTSTDTAAGPSAAVLDACRRAGIARLIRVLTTDPLEDRDGSSPTVADEVGQDSERPGRDVPITTFFIEGRVTDPRVAGTFEAAAYFDGAVARIRSAIEDRSSQSRTVILSEVRERSLAFRAAKRLVDLLFAAGIVVVFWWLLLVVYFVVRAQSPGPGIFSQERVGRGGRTFICFKFRTMYVTAPNVGTHEVPPASITRVGAFLRKTKLDELPQVWNILRNEMSLVGPRPCLPSQLRLIEAREKYGVFDLKPGITGLAQVNGIDMSEPERLAIWDARYARLQSLTLDFKIILATALGRGGGDKVQHGVASKDTSPPQSSG